MLVKTQMECLLEATQFELDATRAALRELVDATQTVYASGRIDALAWLTAHNLVQNEGVRSNG